MSQHFVKEDSIIREIWGKSDTILFIFAGAAAEFALNKAVDWLYFTGKLPADPLGRLFSTVTYARRIIFAPLDAAHAAIDQITAIHRQVETARQAQIPDWAYRDVLFMLIDYSIRSFELLERKLTFAEKEEVFNVFHAVGTRMGLTGLPTGYADWRMMRKNHLETDLVLSDFTFDLFDKYRQHLGIVRYFLLLQVQSMMVPGLVKRLLSLHHSNRWMLQLYKLCGKINLQDTLKNLLLPPAYKIQIQQLNTSTT
jgi:hypothetical protein